MDRTHHNPQIKQGRCIKNRLLTAARLVILAHMVLLGLYACGGDDAVRTDQVSIDLKTIQQRGTLRAITTFSSTSYFIYRGQPMGFEYELLQRLADHLDVKLEIVLADNLDHLFDMLLEGEGDLIAHNLTITKARTEIVNFTIPHVTTHQVLVQRRPEGWRRMKLHEINRQLIRNPVELIGKTVHVRKNSSYYQRLQNLSEEIGGDIDIVPVEGNLSTEQLIRMVADGEIDYTVADENLAFITRTYHPGIDVKTVVSLPQRVAWAVRKSSPKLLTAVNSWLAEIKETPDYYTIYNKYFRNRKAFRRRSRSDFFTVTGNRISPYDSLIRDQATDLGWDWRLLASMIYQESQFDPDAESWAGARGLMQLMPAMAEKFGQTDLYDPNQSIEAGVAYLTYLQEKFADIPDTLERIKFVLAAYNAGENHVNDARRLAAKYGEDDEIWTDNVEEYMLRKSDPEYYKDEAVRYGYSRGSEPVNYVREILDRYEHYRRLVDYDIDSYDDSADDTPDNQPRDTSQSVAQ